MKKVSVSCCLSVCLSVFLSVCRFLPCFPLAHKPFNPWQFPKKNQLPFYFTSAADGTNVVKVFREAIRTALDYKLNTTDFMDQVRLLRLLSTTN